MKYNMTENNKWIIITMEGWTISVRGLCWMEITGQGTRLFLVPGGLDIVEKVEKIHTFSHAEISMEITWEFGRDKNIVAKKTPLF